MKTYLDDAARHIARAANEGTIAAARTFAAQTGANAAELEGTISVVLEGANAVAHEFGTLHSPARPVLSPALRERRREIVRATGEHIAKALKA
ncbi:MAG: hypothetical protein ACT4OG_01335 [Alphaproteobacteria bacterium]